MATFGHDYINSRASTDVNVVGFAGNALDGILKAIQESKKATEDLRSDINDNAEEQDKKDAADKVASVASERRQRAANAAIHGKIDKGFTLMGLVQKSLEKIASYVGNIATRTIKSLDDSVRTQRKLMLSSAQIVANQKTASRIAGEVRDYGVSPNDVRKMTDALAEQGVLATDFSDKQLKLIAVAMNKNKMSAEKAVKLALQSRGEEDSMIKTLIQATDLTGRKTTEDVLSKIDSSVFQIFAKSVGGTQQGISVLSDLAKQIDSKFGMYMSAENQTKLVDTFMKLKSGQIELVGDDVNALLGLGIDTRDPTKIADQIMEGIKNNKFNENNIKVLRSIEGFGEDLAKSILSMQKAFNENGNLQTKKIQSEQENKDAAKASVEGGIFGNWLSNVFTDLDDVTGGMFSALSTQLNEWFGEDVSLEDAVKDGFKKVIELLTTISVSQLISGGTNFISSLFAGGAAGAAGAGAGAAVAGAAGAGAAGAGAGAAVAAKNAKFAKYAKIAGKAGIIGAIAAGGVWLGSELFSSSDENSPQSGDMTNTGEGLVNYYSSMLSLVNDIRNAVYNVSSNTPLNESDSPLNAPNESLSLIQGIASSFTSPIETAGIKMGENFAKKVAPNAVAKASEKAALRAAEKAALETAEAAGTTVAKVGLKTTLKGIGKFLGPAGMVIDAGITTYEVVNDLAEANRQEQTGKNLAFELFAKQHELNKAKKNNDADAVARLSLEIGSLESVIDKAALAQEAATDQAVVHGAGGLGGLGGAAAGALLGGAIGSVVPVIGTVIGGAVGGIVGGVAGMLGGEALAEAAVKDTPEQRAEKIRQKRESYQAELQGMQKKASEKGIAESVALSLVASAKNMEEFESKLDGIVQMQKMGLGEDELEFLAESAKNSDEMQALTKQLRSDPNKVYRNVGSIAVDISAMRTNLMSIYHRVYEILAGLQKTMQFATGGIVTRATPAVIGEAGKEAVVPLERPEDMKRVLGALSPTEKFKLIKALFNSNYKKLTWELLASVMLNTLGVGKATSSDPVVANDEFVKNVLQGAAAQKGKSYAEIVCNQLVEAALKHAGFKTPTTGIVTKHFNHKDMRLVLNDPINGISPTDPRLVPGMILFSHPFTQAEADELNRRKGGRRKAGDPGHMGIYAGDGLWWNSTSSKNTTDYSTGKGVKVTDSNKGIGVALTKPFKKGTYKLYAAGYYDGMFSASEVSGANVSKNIPYEPSVNKAQGILSDVEINEILAAAGVSNSAAMKQYIEQAKQLVGNNNNKDDIIAVLLEIARYLKGIAASPANKPPMMSVARPYTTAYGT